MRKGKPRKEMSVQIIVFTAGIGMFLSTLDTGIINVALPTLEQAFNSSISVISWTITLYTLVLIGSVILFGRLSDIYGRLKIYSWGLIIFMVSSVLCGFSTSIGELIVFRAIQGIGASMLQATATSLITTTIPNERQGSALGTLSVLIGLGPVLGPSIGGLLISLASWRWIFWVNVPFALAGIIGCSFLTNVVNDSRQPIKLDLLGNVILSISILVLLQGLSLLSTLNLLNLASITMISLFAILFILFIFWEMRNVQPIVDLKLFLNGSFTAPILGVFMLGGATSVGFIVPPFFLEQVSLLKPWQVGLVNLSAPLGLVLMSKISGRLMKKNDTTHIMVTGLIIMTVAYGILGMMQSDWGPTLIALLLLLYGFGAGLFMPPNTFSIMSAVNQDIQGTIGAIQRMIQNLGIALFTAITSIFIRTHSHEGVEKLITGFRTSWSFAAMSLLISLTLFLSVILRRRMLREY